LTTGYYWGILVPWYCFCNNAKNPREEYLRTKNGYIQQWQTQVEGNSNKEKKSQSQACINAE
jgi:hypothetical protein